MDSLWQSVLAIAVAAGCAGLVGWRVVRPFLRRRPRLSERAVPSVTERSELIQIDPAPANPASTDSGDGAADGSDPNLKTS